MKISLINTFNNKCANTINFSANKKPLSYQKNLPYSDDETSSYRNGTDRAFITSINSYKNFNGKPVSYMLNHQFEIIKNENGEPSKIVFTKQSNLLKGAYEKTLYELKNYPQELDMIKEIKENSIKGAKPLCYTIKNEDGSIEYFENLTTNGSKIKRHYTKNGKNYTLDFIIKDENDKEILKLNRTFKVNKNGSTTTINGKKYTAKFDDKNKTMKLEGENGESTIDFAKKFDSFSNSDSEILFNAAKNLPIDALAILDKNVSYWQFSSGLASSYMHINCALFSNDDLSIICHELGHAHDFKNVSTLPLALGLSKDDKKLIKKYYEDPNIFSNDKEFRKTFRKEYKKFNETHTTKSGENFIAYFKERPDLKDIESSFSEVFAEAYMILTTGFHDSKLLSDRAQVLVQNFPKTIARAATLLNLNAVK